LSRFIEAAARCYIHALQHEEADIPGLVDLYAKIDRMRILSSAKVVEIAERFRGRSSTLIRNRTRASLSCVRWSIATRSTFGNSA
jgi:hypothetical protein